ncbi:transcriptional regulator, MarR family [Myxococcus xanthus DK 1622]|uniref:Transcriptional regulator, MarR family n=2 Tax=Myxococcus TaxID=32 RepID=Q1D2D9_MYXXD|nr:MarR family transcriptional regulator [Myxococcus xanthus]ABF92124.1 transcriptional regulator, MarR family [Myxococcus xanthus DK 1622]QVW66611.1 MarR family transcriptional regulator [Myxococcus xanthus DZ2]NOJ56667.1 MarR family transcriptional regulator [Myxococcus xanthus]QPM77544.1 MarR family transcriptional regulator [Myxococcus xanthus]QZZ52693.1 Transcriptional regulator SlyA [Myxococcus xanthus]
MTVPEQMASLRRAIRRLLTERLGEQTSRPFMQLLALKSIADGVRSQSAIAERMLVDAPSVSRLVARLEEDGLVKRSIAEDRRCARLELSPAGQTELNLLRDALIWTDVELLRYLTVQEMAEFKRLTVKLLTGLLQARGPVPLEGGCGPSDT